MTVDAPRRAPGVQARTEGFDWFGMRARRKNQEAREGRAFLSRAFAKGQQPIKGEHPLATKQRKHDEMVASDYVQSPDTGAIVSNRTLARAKARVDAAEKKREAIIEAHERKQAKLREAEERGLQAGLEAGARSEGLVSAPRRRWLRLV